MPESLALRLPRAIKRPSRYAALVLDDLGYLQQDRQEMEALVTLLAERYGRGSPVIRPRETTRRSGCMEIRLGASGPS
jgi:hypothetical protein